MAEPLFGLRPGDQATVLRGRYHGFPLKDQVVQVVREDEEFLDFWWCVWDDRRGNGLVQREVLLNASQLVAIKEGDKPC